MGAIGGLIGVSGGASGTGFAAPVQADIQKPTTVGQINNAYDQNQQALQQQQGLLSALQQQGGLQNQSSVFNQMQNVANGQGPNPAQAMLQQQTGQNVANQAALMAGQRGAGANAGLMARQAAMAGGNLQQQAVGQGATMQANQSMNALNNMGNIANTQATNQIGATNAYTGAQQAQQANLLNAMGAQNTATVSSQNNVNTGNAGLANTQMQGQQAMIGGLMKAASGAFAGGGQVPGFDDGGMAGGLGVSTEIQKPNIPANSSTIGAMDTSLGNPVLGQSAPGGRGDAFAQANLGVPTQMPAMPSAPTSSFGQFLSKVDSGAPAEQSQYQFSPDSGAAALYEGASSLGGAAMGKSSSGGGGGDSGGGMASMLPLLAMAASKGGMVDVRVSPGEKIVPPEKVKKAAGGNVEAKTVPGSAPIAGDNVKNDTVKTKLAPGTIIVPRTKSGNTKDSAKFVRSVLAKRGKK